MFSPRSNNDSNSSPVSTRSEIPWNRRGREANAGGINQTSPLGPLSAPSTTRSPVAVIKPLSSANLSYLNHQPTRSVASSQDFYQSPPARSVYSAPAGNTRVGLPSNPRAGRFSPAGSVSGRTTSSSQQPYSTASSSVFTPRSADFWEEDPLSPMDRSARSNLPPRPSRPSRGGVGNERPTETQRRLNESRSSPSLRDRSRREGPPRSSRRDQERARSPEPAVPPIGEDKGDTSVEGAWGWAKLKQQVWKEGATPDETEPVAIKATSDQPAETLWTKLIVATSTLQKKLNGEDGYASDASDFKGETHLTRVMKEYHVEQAQSSSDLPKWLFSVQELRGHAAPAASAPRTPRPTKPSRTRSDSPSYSSDEEDASALPPARTGGLRDIFDSVQKKPTPGGHRGKQESQDSGYGSMASSTASGHGQSKYAEKYGYGAGPTVPLKGSAGRLAVARDVKRLGRDRLAGAGAAI